MSLPWVDFLVSALVSFVPVSFVRVWDVVLRKEEASASVVRSWLIVWFLVASFFSWPLGAVVFEGVVARVELGLSLH